MIGQWTYCYNRRGAGYLRFVTEYFGRPEAQLLLICGSGFDPRAPVIPRLIASVAGSTTVAWLIREERPDAPRRLREVADDATAQLLGLFRIENSRIIRFDVFAPDGAVVAGANLMKEIGRTDLTRYTDVIADISSLSTGVAFPLVKWLHERALRGEVRNVHLALTADAEVDAAIRFTASDKVQAPKGFAYGSHANTPEAKMWIPQLQVGQNQSLEKIYQSVAPQDVCPILPFPTAALRTPEDLILSYGDLLDTWNVDPSSIIYSTEDCPLDIYRTVVRLKAERDATFRALGTSEIIITPMGSKVVAMGTLLAALELELTVQYVEAEGFVVTPQASRTDRGVPMGLWLHGGPAWSPTK